ncbi:hypothetical protein ACO1O0_007162 [Amphichorda felina]
MMFKTMFQITATALASSFALGAPAPEVANLAARGEMTYYEPGLGACGQTNGPGELIVAVSASRYDQQNLCGKKIKVQGSRGEVVVTVVDRCAGCARDDLDLSPAAFKQAIGDLGIGRTEGRWGWA